MPKPELDRIILAPHPDDEVLGCTSLLGRGALVVLLTDGLPPRATNAGDQAVAKAVRVTESRAAAEALAADCEFRVLDFQDLSLPSRIADLAGVIVRIARELPSATIYAPAYQRGHPDHDATFVAAYGALARQGEIARLRCYSLYGLDAGGTERFGWLDETLYLRSRLVAGDCALLDRKVSAIRAFESQLGAPHESVLSRWLLDPSAECFADPPVRVDRGFLCAMPCYFERVLGFERKYGVEPGRLIDAFCQFLEC